MKKALIWLLPVFSLIGSAAAGLYLAPAPEAAADHAADGEGGGEAKPTGHPDRPAAACFCFWIRMIWTAICRGCGMQACGSCESR